MLHQCDTRVDLFISSKWDDGDKNAIATSISERVYEMLKVCNINASSDLQETSVRQLPPSVIELQGRPAAFPLGLGHAVDYISPGAVLIGYTYYNINLLTLYSLSIFF